MRFDEGEIASRQVFFEDDGQIAGLAAVLFDLRLKKIHFQIQARRQEFDGTLDGREMLTHQ